MPRKKAAKNVRLDDLEKPLSEQEMKETTGGFGQILPPPPKIIPPGAPQGVHIDAPPSYSTNVTTTKPADVILKDGNLIVSPGQTLTSNGTQPPVYVNPNVKFTPPPSFNAGSAGPKP
ncbi:hypothetical protein [Paenibacillus ginsengarvi]|uniref:Uncharacterized protein n=1 Tax=Paenibacillus ginsengarvi TaxID=400777 RepID=A0A3B0AKG0_9BACL|nr:hypothetical protein [Paenibacillus ginsengarvi]RKN60831.1 hypothetical protein D7M11_35630 [Paenibacillus ginsengarvi]